MTGDDLLRFLELNSWEGFVSFVCVYTDDLEDFDYSPRTSQDGVDVLTTFGGDLGQEIQFPTTIREVTFDLQSADDATRKDWKGFTREAARRSIPMSEIYHGSLDPEQDKQPEDWVLDEDGT